jgi:hypothetical protein
MNPSLHVLWDLGALTKPFPRAVLPPPAPVRV